MGRRKKKRSPLVIFGFVGVLCAAIIFALRRDGNAPPQPPPIEQVTSRATNPIIGSKSTASNFVVENLFPRAEVEFADVQV